jgi:hypothetical protein
MNLYVCTDHDGHYPVGVCSVIVASSEENARHLLMAELEVHGLNASKAFTLRKLSMDVPKAFVLRDGDY